MNYKAEIEMIRQHLLKEGLLPLECVQCFTVGNGEQESLVVHFAKHIPTLPGEEHLTYFDSTGSTICVNLNFHTGKITIHNES